MIHGFDVIDFSSSRPGDKFAKSGFTRGQASRVDAPTVNEAPIHLECRLTHTLRVPPMRTVFIADVVATTVHDGICDADGRLRDLAPSDFVLSEGDYRLTFDTGAYLSAAGADGFYTEVVVSFVVRDAAAHYHVPLLLSPYGYTTYRGS